MSDQIRILQTNVANDILVKFDTPIETFQIAPLAVGIYWSVYGVSFLEIGCFNFILSRITYRHIVITCFVHPTMKLCLIGFVRNAWWRAGQGNCGWCVDGCVW